MLITPVFQPPGQAGALLTEWLAADPPPQRVVLVSAFAKFLTAARFREGIGRVRAAGGRVTVVLGIDLYGTSVEALREVLAWDGDAWVVHNRRAEHTFHPKVYAVEAADTAHVLVGSHNLTDGGLYTNYEASTHYAFRLPEDAAEYARVCAPLAPVLAPTLGAAQPLTASLIADLVARDRVRTEVEIARGRRRALAAGARADGAPAPALPEMPFGREVIASAPPLPTSVLRAPLAGVEALERARKTTARRARAAAKAAGAGGHPATPTIPPLAGATAREAEAAGLTIDVDAFFMQLNRMPNDPADGDEDTTTPGELRIPYAVRDLAPRFWEWPDRYTERTTNRATGRPTKHRYIEWYSRWRVYDVTAPDAAVEQSVRIYDYSGSSDFRFYPSHVAALGGRKGDVLRITRPQDGDVEYECVLARAGVPEHAAWLAHCTRLVASTDRRFGYV